FNLNYEIYHQFFCRLINLPYHRRVLCCLYFNKFLLEHCNKFQLELECSKWIPMKLTNEIQIQYHTNKFHWSISFEETILEPSNSVPMFQCSNVPIAQHCHRVNECL